MAGDVKTTPSEIANLDQSESMAEIKSENVTTEIQPENVTIEACDKPILTVDQEFRGLIPPHTYGEFKALKEDIQTHGCHDPLIIWKGQGIILDGHRRYEICIEEGIPFEIVEVEFPNRTEAKIWMIKNQIGRRNLNESQRAMLAVKLEALYSVPAKDRMGTRTDRGQNLDPCEAGRSAEKAADDMNISHQTVSYAKNVVQKGIPELKMIVESGKLAVSAAKKVASYPSEVQEKIVEEVITQIDAGRHPKIAAIIREFVPETEGAQKKDAVKQLEKFRKNQEATLKLLEGITERPENLAELLALAEKINARLKEIETKTLDPSIQSVVNAPENPQSQCTQGLQDENSKSISHVEDDVETKVLDDGLKSAEENSSGCMDDSFPDSWGAYEEAIKREMGTNDI